MDDTTKTARALPTAEEVRALLDYDPETGVFTWRRRPQPRGPKVGTVAGTTTSWGYRQICIGRRFFPAHRLAWLHVCGVWPADQLDHKNGQRSDNRLSNLRETTAAENQQNYAKTRSPTSSRYLGVIWYKKTGRWAAKIQLNRKTHNLGYFATEELAYAAYLAAKSLLHPAQPAPRESAYGRR